MVRTALKEFAAKKSVQIGMIAILVIAIAVVIVTRVRIAAMNRVQPGTPVTTMEAQRDGEYVYRFDSVAWVYDFDQSYAVDPVTKVSFQFVNFSRRETLIPAVFYKPFLVGVIDGSCSESTELPVDMPTPFAENTACTNGPLLAVSHCGDTYLAIYQCGINLHVARSLSQPDMSVRWENMRTLDMSTLVN